MHRLTKCNYAVHEACHICACCCNNIACDAEIGIDLETSECHVSAMTWHVDGSTEENLFVLYAGITGSKLFHLGTAGTLKDLHDVRAIDAPESTKQRAQKAAEVT